MLTAELAQERLAVWTRRTPRKTGYYAVTIVEGDRGIPEAFHWDGTEWFDPNSNTRDMPIVITDGLLPDAVRVTPSNRRHRLVLHSQAPFASYKEALDWAWANDVERVEVPR